MNSEKTALKKLNRIVMDISRSEKCIIDDLKKSMLREVEYQNSERSGFNVCNLTDNQVVRVMNIFCQKLEQSGVIDLGVFSQFGVEAEYAVVHYSPQTLREILNELLTTGRYHPAITERLNTTAQENFYQSQKRAETIKRGYRSIKVLSGVGPVFELVTTLLGPQGALEVFHGNPSPLAEVAIWLAVVCLVWPSADNITRDSIGRSDLERQLKLGLFGELFDLEEVRVALYGHTPQQTKTSNSKTTEAESVRSILLEQIRNDVYTLFLSGYTIENILKLVKKKKFHRPAKSEVAVLQAVAETIRHATNNWQLEVATWGYQTIDDRIEANLIAISSHMANIRKQRCDFAQDAFRQIVQ